ncbi:MAG TPA: hypothetical protein EYP31_03175, partial [Roseibacterium sp.]|nr:hypothetical protein [Roseibacterium sp.]
MRRAIRRAPPSISKMCTTGPHTTGPHTTGLHTTGLHTTGRHTTGRTPQDGRYGIDADQRLAKP